jgi:acetolactate synthase-1/3 small subunit
MKTRIFSILCQNIPGVMMRITRDFTRRQINLDSITVGVEPSGLARIILMFNADDHMAEFMQKVLARLEPILSVEAIDQSNSVVRVVALIKTKKLVGKDHWDVVNKIERAGGKIVDTKEGAIVAEVSGAPEEVERIINALGPQVITEVARSGRVYVSKNIG